MPVPFGFSVGDFVTLGQLAFRVYRSYQDAPSNFSELSDDVKILHLHLKEVADRLEEDGRRILPSQRVAMQEVAISVQVTLDRLDGIMGQYSAMDMQRQLTWERLRWQAEDQMQIKQDITVKLIAVSNLNQSLSGSSTAKLLLNLQKLVSQAIVSRKQGTIVSALTNADVGEDHLWISIGRDLQVAGISREMVTANRDVIREQIQHLFGSGLMATDVASEDISSTWESVSVGGSASTVGFSRATSTASTIYEPPQSYNPFHPSQSSQGLQATYPESTRRKSREDGRQRNELPQSPWYKLTYDCPPLNDEDATYRPYVVEIKLVTPETKSSTHTRDGFSFKRNYVSEHSWVFLRLSQHTRDGIKSLSTPDPYNPVQDHGRSFSQRWTEYAFSRAFLDWKGLLLRSDQPVYVCLPNSQENALETLAREHAATFPVAFSFDIDTDTILFWKLSRRWAGSSTFQYREKTMDEVPRKGLLQYIKRISLRKQAKALSLEGSQGQGQMLLMLFTQKAIDQSRPWVHTWMTEQDLNDKRFAIGTFPSNTVVTPSTTPYTQSTASPYTGPTQVYYPTSVQPPSLNIESNTQSYLAKASAVCGFEASTYHELSFETGDEIWVTQYKAAEIWEGINQRNQLKGEFPNTLVKLFLIKKMPSRENLPHEIGSSMQKFGASPADHGLLSPSSVASNPSLQNRTHRSASTGALPSQSQPIIHYELDSTPIYSVGHQVTKAPQQDSNTIQQNRLTRITSSVSDRGPGRDPPISVRGTSGTYETNPFKAGYVSPSRPAEPSIGRSQSQRAWAPSPLGSGVSPAGFSEHTSSPRYIPSPYQTPAAPDGGTEISSPVIAPANNEPAPAWRALLPIDDPLLRARISAFEQMQEATQDENEMILSGNLSEKKSSVSLAAGDKEPSLSPTPTVTSTESSTQPHGHSSSLLPKWPFDDSRQTDVETPMISSEMEQKMFSLSVRPRPKSQTSQTAITPIIEVNEG